MKPPIPTSQLGAQSEGAAAAIDSCVHCGFCLPTCPTYLVMGKEMTSPRGRIVLMKETLAGELELDETLPFIDSCLGCEACVTACPSGVEYGDLLMPFRELAEQSRARSKPERAQRSLLLRTMAKPSRFRAAARAGRLARPFRRLLPESARTMIDQLPAQIPARQGLPAVVPAEGERRARVALLSGCVQQVLDQEINLATLRVLARNGVETVIPKEQGCCGALAMHVGEGGEARALARRNLRAFPADVDAVITNAAGCGSGMRDYGRLLAGTPDAEAAEALAERTVDVSAFLHELGLRAPLELAEPLTVAYHDACHLGHAQGVREAPRSLLRSIGNLTLVEPAEQAICCGSAGTYSIEQPETAAELGARKADNLIGTGADLVAAGNIGCLVQIRNSLERQGQQLPAIHTMQLLDRAQEPATRTP